MLPHFSRKANESARLEYFSLKKGFYLFRVRLQLAKGSPEALRKLAVPASLPSDFEAELGRHTREGLRVLGLATRQLLGVTEAEVQVRR